VKNVIAPVFVILGMVCLAVSFFWTVVSPSSTGWTPEKAVRMGELTGEVHAMMFQVQAASTSPKMHSGQNPAELKAQLEEKEKELAQLRDEFEGKRDGPSATARIFRWTGVIAIVIGAIATAATRSS
jgi:hypothetical protein